jgi:hypothetical protein
MVMDPNNSTPPNDFIDALKHRMSVYYQYQEEMQLGKCTAK